MTQDDGVLQNMACLFTNDSQGQIPEGVMAAEGLPSALY